MTTKKMTKKDYFNTLLSIEAVQANPSLVEFINHEMELLSRKNSGERKPTAQQTANEGIKAEVAAILADGTPRTVGEILKELNKGDDLTHSRLTAIVTQMKKDEVVNRHEIKRKAYFSLA